jgi:hypothetical protein
MTTQRNPARAKRCRLAMTAQIALVLTGICHCSPVTAQMASVPDIVAQKSLWVRYAEEGRRIQFEGRFRSRAVDTFRLEKFEVPCRLPASIRLPDRMTDGQRIELTGKFMKDGNVISFLVNRLIVRGLDAEELSNHASSVSDDQPDELLQLAESYVADADFYNDERLREQITRIRGRAISAKRKRARGNISELNALLATADSLRIDPRDRAVLVFEILVEQAKAETTDLASLMTVVKSLPGWDLQTPAAPPRLQNDFVSKAVSLYEASSDEDRRFLHRLLFTQLRLRQIQDSLKDDGSNGLALAETIRRELPDQTTLVAEFEQKEVDYQLRRVILLNRQELQQTVDLLNRLQKNDAIPEAVSAWLKEQKRRFGTETLGGLLRTADEHFFAADLALGADTRNAGIELLKQAWEVAMRESPQDATEIASRLKTFGWEHFSGKWMTAEQIQMIPDTDVELAIRDGRIVPGMTATQVLTSRGEPARIARVGSSRLLRELWIYDADGTAGIVIRFRRSLVSKVDPMVVEEVSRIIRPR